MYIPINKKKGMGIELSSVNDDWRDDNYAMYGFGFDIIVTIKTTLHIIGFSVQSNHVALCLLNSQIVLFWRN